MTVLATNRWHLCNLENDSLNSSEREQHKPAVENPASRRENVTNKKKLKKHAFRIFTAKKHITIRHIYPPTQVETVFSTWADRQNTQLLRV